MPLTKVKKAEKIEQLTKELEGSTSAIVGSFTKLTVTQDFELRKVVRGAGGRYRVLKNKLAARASKGTGVESALQGLKGVSSVAYTNGDPVALAKALSAWVSNNAEFSFRLGIVDGNLISIEEIKQLATMPAKEEIYAKLLFLISSPAQRLATVISATGRNLAVVVNQGVEKGKFAAPETPVAAPAPVVEAAETPAVQGAAVEAQTGATQAPSDEAPVAQEAATQADASPQAEAATQADASPQAEAATQAEATPEVTTQSDSSLQAEGATQADASPETEAAPETAPVAEPEVSAASTAEVHHVPESQAAAASTEEPVEGPAVADEPAGPEVAPESSAGGEQP